MSYAINTYTGDGSTVNYSVTFPYIEQAHVVVTLDGVTKTLNTDYSFTTSSTITFTTAPSASVVIKFTRSSSRNARLVDYQDGSTLTEATLDQDGNQSFYIAQEAIDITDNNISLSVATDQWDALNKRITNVANPVNNNDAVNKTYLENTWLSTSDKANLTTVAGISGAVSTVAGISSAVSGVNSNNADVSTVAGQISPTNNISTLAGINADITAVANNNADVSTVAGQISPTNNISTLAGLDTEITGVYNIRTNVTNVDGNSANINLVAGQISPTNNISALGAVSSQIGTLGALGTEITNLNNIRTDITGVNTISNQVQTVAGLNTEITNLYNIRTDITAVSNIASDIQDVQDKIAELQTVANDLNEVTSEIDTVATYINQVDAVGTDLLGSNNIGTVASNINTVNDFANRYRVSGTAPTTSLDVGDLYFDTGTNTMRVYSSGGWINAGSSVNGTANRFEYTATAGQTTFSGADSNGNSLSYDAGFLDLYLNGVKLANSDYTATSGTSIVLASPANLNDILMVVAFGTFQLANFSITDANDVPALGSAGQALVVNSGGTALEFANASSAEVYGFHKDSNGDLIVTTTNQGVDNISQSEYANFDDVLFSASGFTFSLSNGELIATI
jgi:uncharacterized protein YoxC